MSIDRLDILRERNKDLLKQLKQQREKLERLSGCGENRQREREAGESVVTVTGTDGVPAGKALAKPSVRFADTCEKETDVRQSTSAPPLTTKHREGATESATSLEFKGSYKHSQRQDRLQDTQPFSPKSGLINTRKEKSDITKRVTFRSENCEDIYDPDRNRFSVLLGYDWIAGVLDSEDSLLECSDEFFTDLHMFRSLNKEECVHSAQAEFSEEGCVVAPQRTDKGDPDSHVDTHQCTFSYRINSRLFPVPLHSQECCPVCRKHKSSHPHTTAEPALIRVSIPRTALLPPHKYKPHRRHSFDPSDSLGLPSHCLSGWSNTGQSTLPPPTSLDLRSVLNMKSTNGSINKELEDLSVPQVSANQNMDQISEVSRLARHHFKHYHQKTKLCSKSDPVC
ncbi:migration and invasion inhibitory protein [Pholidichthys leucotaenia]